jgi:hypothetical protein
MRMLTKALMTLVVLLMVMPSFSQDVINFKDCQNAKKICELKSYHFKDIGGKGLITEPIFESSCLPKGFQETNSIWLELKIKEPGIITFIISPHNNADDIDFLIYQKDDDCSQLRELRCMGSGVNIGDDDAKRSEQCIGVTGLSKLATDNIEYSGCRLSADNFLKFLSVEKEEKILILVNNYDSVEGFSISFEGNAELYTSDICNDQSDELLSLDRLYPNPTTNQINVEISSNYNTSCHIEILDISGRLISKKHEALLQGFNNFVYNTESLKTGTYILRVSDGVLSSSKQFVKK